MTRKAVICKHRRAASAKGFTLAEMIVVLTILSILAAAGIVSTIGYVKNSQFSRNERNAETIYQAVQTALVQKDKSGSIDKWITDNILTYGDVVAYDSTNEANFSLEGKFVSKTEFDDLSPDTALPNESVHIRYCITFIPDNSASPQSDILKKLVQPYFFDDVDESSIFNGTITIEFDVEKAFNAYKECHLTARCLSVFCSSRYKEGWGNNVLVPKRDYTDRRDKTLIGYYDGYTGSSVNSVYLPAIEDGLDVEKFNVEFTVDDESNTHTWLVWNATLDEKNITGTAQRHVFYQIELNPDKTNPTRLILNEDFLLVGQTPSNTVKAVNFIDCLKDVNTDGAVVDIKSDPVSSPIVSPTVKIISQPMIDVKNHSQSTLTTKTITVKANVYKNSDSYFGMPAITLNSNLDKTMDLKITYVQGELDLKGNIKKPYVTYALDISSFTTSTAVTKASIIVCPNDFSDDTLKNLNDRSGLVPMTEKKEVEINSPECC